MQEFGKDFDVRVYKIDETEKEGIIKFITEELKKIEGIRFAILHGSFLSDLPFHDIDVAVFYNENLSEEKQDELDIKLSVELTNKLSIPVDLHGLNRSSITFCYEVVKGRLLFARDIEEFWEFREDVTMRYMDFKVFIEDGLKDLLEI
ncbi:hypothetical protein AN618_04260 [Fervidicola ferrireducens]|jgi:hypothetical protein|uniref:Polymerase beta nucleotidyltransferase domain-containing protein n=1 Tax=Fervidicola ferrireducens TaxID=520764 RepID=A0A140LCT5_9FIRM|nr:nucleotidyltransferase domain-containing protein [Fervidicola ferrireducens]KXG78360.1 hypothetical protein AN618_04260 [Fervidicola ferrireducens]